MSDTATDPAVERYKGMLPRDEAIVALVAKGYSEEDATEAYDAAPARADAQGRSISLVPFSKIEPKWTDWLWQGRIPRGMLALLVGDEGLGKSALTLSIAAALTRGTLDGDFRGNPSRVAVLTTEDDPARTMWPRIEAAGADKDRIFNLKMKRDGQDSGIAFPQDAPAVGRALGEANVRLVIVDPIAAALDPKVNTWKDTDVRSALTPLIVAAEEHDFAVLALLHTNKRNNATAREKAMGSAGSQQIPRSAMLLGKNPDDEDGQVLAHFKCNVGRRMATFTERRQERRKGSAASIDRPPCRPPGAKRAKFAAPRRPIGGGVGIARFPGDLRTPPIRQRGGVEIPRSGSANAPHSSLPQLPVLRVTARSRRPRAVDRAIDPRQSERPWPPLSAAAGRRARAPPRRRRS
jgi:hypothetical protein